MHRALLVPVLPRRALLRCPPRRYTEQHHGPGLPAQRTGLAPGHSVSGWQACGQDAVRSISAGQCYGKSRGFEDLNLVPGPDHAR